MSDCHSVCFCKENETYRSGIIRYTCANEPIEILKSRMCRTVLSLSACSMWFRPIHFVCDTPEQLEVFCAHGADLEKTDDFDDDVLHFLINKRMMCYDTFFNFFLVVLRYQPTVAIRFDLKRANLNRKWEQECNDNIAFLKQQLHHLEHLLIVHDLVLIVFSYVGLS